MSSFRRRLMMAQEEGSNIPSDDGVYIQSIDGKFYTLNEWNRPNNEANGIAVISKSHPNGGFVIAKDDNIGERKRYGGRQTIDNITTTTNPNIAKTDYQGYENTEQIIAQDGNAEAAIYCKNYTFINGKKGYLGSCGEWQMAYNNKSAINRCLYAIGGQAIIYYNYHWNSTQYSSSSSWAMRWDDNDLIHINKEMLNYVRAFSTL